MAEAQAENLRLLMEISGLDRTAAEQILTVNAHDLERAINFHLESQTDPLPGSSSGVPSLLPNMPDLTATAAAVPYENDEGIRAPIPPKRETMLLPEEDNFRFRKRRNTTHNVCPLRNFEREGELQEAQLASVLSQDGHGSGLAGSSSSGSGTSSNMAGTSLPIVVDADDIVNGGAGNFRPKRRRLGDLFRPPVDLSFAGTLHAAREFAKQRDRWVIVNLQDNAEFMSQLLNRDIWSNRQLKLIIQKYFIFWQVAIDNAEGARFRVFYDAQQLPYVGIIDPRTGEEKLSYKNGFKLTAAEFANELKEYLRINSLYPSGGDGVEINDLAITDGDLSASSSSSRRRGGNSSDAAKEMTSLSEEEQLLMAIQNSLRESQSDDAPVIELDSDTESDPATSDAKHHNAADAADTGAVETYTKYLGWDKDPMTKVVLRLPDGHRDTLEWPSSSRLQALRLYVEHQYPELTKEPYKIICPFPRQDVLELDMALSLQEAKMHPSVLLHVHRDE